MVAEIPPPATTKALSSREMSTGTLSPFTVAAPSPASASGATGAGTAVVVVVLEAMVDVVTAVVTTGAERTAVVGRDVATSFDSSSASSTSSSDTAINGAAAVEGVAAASSTATAVVVVGDTNVVVVVVVVGGGFEMVNVKVSADVPPELVAVTVYEVAGWVAVGVPLTRPVDALNDNPDGRAGEMEYDRAGPPEFEIVYSDDTGVPTIAVPDEALSEMLGAGVTIPQAMLREA